MAYVGNPIDTTNTFQSLVGKRFSGDGSTTAFTLDVAPSSTLDIEVFVGNVRQDPNSAYTLSGTTLTFTGAPPSGTNNIYVVHQAKSVGTIDVPASGVQAGSLASSVLTGQTDIGGAIADADLFLVDDGAGGTLRKTAASRIKTYAGFSVSDITGATELAATPADTDELIISDAGTLKRIDYSYLKSVNTPAFLAHLNGSNQSLSHDTHTKIQFNTEVYDTASAYSHDSSYQFTVPSNQGGKYFFYSAIRFNDSSANLSLKFVVGGSNKSVASMKGVSGEATTLNHTFSQSLSAGDTVEIQGRFQSSGTLNVLGHNSEFDTHFGGFKLAE